jgi:uncharacterized membrane protein
VEGHSAPARDSIEFTRIIAFTDGVFAIAITLLVLSLNVPPGVSESELHDYLVESWPQLFAYFLSFAVVGRFWISHHQVFALLHGFDRRLMVLNLMYLSLIVLIPFPTELLGDYGSETDAVVIYAFVVGTASVLSWAMLAGTLRRGHVQPESRAAARELAAGARWPAIVFYASIPVAFVSPVAGQLVWIALLADPLRARL